MFTIIVTTDFSKSAHNALQYACAFAKQATNVNFILLNIFTVPDSYAADGVSLAAINDSLTATENKLKQEFEWLTKNNPGFSIRYKEVVGEFVRSLQQQVDEENATMVAMGTPDEYGELWSWDKNVLNALTHLSVPVLTVPFGAEYKTIRHIAFACILESVSTYTPVAAIRSLLAYTGAALDVVTIMAPGGNEAAAIKGNELLHGMLNGTAAQYHKIYDGHIVAAIGTFVASHHTELLLVQPRKHGIWYKLFHKSYSKELARLNFIPVMALPTEKKVALLVA